MFVDRRRSVYNVEPMGAVAFFLFNILQAIFLATWSAVWMTAAAIVAAFSSELPLIMARNVWAPPLLWASGARVQMMPGYRIDPAKTYIFVMNHQSMLDIAVAVRYVPVNMRFVLKKALLYVPFLNLYVWRTKMIWVDRSNPKQAYKSLHKAAARIRDGISVIAYPEGTRENGPVRPFKRGVFVLAQAAGVPIVPMAVQGAGNVLPKGGFRLRPAEVRFVIGEPINTADFGDSPEEIARLVRTA
ncbi:MAG: lysophospholipid acyltransferase family protein, partial [Myxococcota bacterium]